MSSAFCRCLIIKGEARVVPFMNGLADGLDVRSERRIRRQRDHTEKRSNGEQRYPVQATTSVSPRRCVIRATSGIEHDEFTRIVRGLSASIPCSTPAEIGRAHV